TLITASAMVIASERNEFRGGLANYIVTKIRSGARESEMMHPTHMGLGQSMFLDAVFTLVFIDHDLRARLETADYLDRSTVIEAADHGDPLERLPVEHPQVGGMLRATVMSHPAGLVDVIGRKTQTLQRHLQHVVALGGD